ncbi:MAG: CAP domain-containing protein [Legionellales bacterium]
MTLKTFLLSLLFFVTAILSVPLFVSAQKKTDNSYKDMAADILMYVNQHRTETQLKPLIMNKVISQAAQNHSRNMGDNKIPFGHIYLDERVAGINKQLKQTATAWAENVASGQHNAKGVVEMWLNSQGHRGNIEGDYNLTGIGIAKGKDGSLYFTQIFIKKSP